MSIKFILILLGSLQLLACGGGGGSEGSGSSDQRVVINFNSVNAANYGELTLKTYDPTPVSIVGTLLLPSDLRLKVPAMVIVHGSSGITEGREFEWASYLTSLGIAAFVVDSFTPRGVNDASLAGITSTVYGVVDALNALVYLSTHPNIDATRIGVMGGSRGGNVSYATAFEEARSGIISSSLKFAAHIPFYPNCNVRRTSPNMTQSPMLFLLGQSDDYTPAAACTQFAGTLLTVVPDITTISYPNAYHGFDMDVSVGIRPVLTFRACAAEQTLDTLGYRRYDTGQVLANSTAFNNYIASCQQVGATVGMNPAAEAQAKIDVQVFLTRVFSL